MHVVRTCMLVCGIKIVLSFGALVIVLEGLKPQKSGKGGR